jgi:hypothetical protein
LALFGKLVQIIFHFLNTEKHFSDISYPNEFSNVAPTTNTLFKTKHRILFKKTKYKTLLKKLSPSSYKNILKTHSPFKK